MVDAPFFIFHGYVPHAGEKKERLALSFLLKTKKRKQRSKQVGCPK
jgi:hypothetical protein